MRRRASPLGDIEQRLIHPRAADTFRERFDRLALLEHPAIRRVLKCEINDQGRIISLEPPSEMNMRQLIELRPLSPERTRRLIARLADALAAAHRVGLSHGHLDPREIGIEGELPRIELTGTRALTPSSDRYASSLERPSDEPSDCRDVFALGALAVALLTGEPWRTGGSLPASWAQDAPLIARMMADDPYARPSAAEVARLLSSNTSLAPKLSPRRAVSEETKSESPEAWVGTLLGRFQVEELLGEGAMGVVYKAIDQSNGQTVALKILKDWAFKHEEVRRRFRKEAQVLAEVKSPYVANLIEANVDGAVDFIALEFVEGMNLEAYLEKSDGRLPEREALTIIADACRALLEPHRRGIVHRDIKPENILVVSRADEPVAIKVLDFGIARSGPALSNETALTQAGAILGTPDYMSPEQCTGAECLASSDVYSLGATLFHLLTGRPPFEGEDAATILTAHIAKPVPDVSKLADVTTSTAQLLQRTLEKSADVRFQDAQELLEAVEKVLRGEPTSLALHPHLPRAQRTFEYSFQWDLVSSPAELWPHVSNTERMNQAVGLPPISVDRIVEQDGTVRTFLENRVLGQKLRWEEFPFEWVEGRRWGLVRVFEQGIMSWYSVELELEPLPSGGTRLTYRMRFEPHNWLGRVIVFLEMGLKQRRSLERLFRRIDASCVKSDRSLDPFVAPKAMSSRAQRTLKSHLGGLAELGISREILDRFERFLEDAPEQEVARIRPLAFARTHELPATSVVNAFLYGVQSGLFMMLWDVICPLCRIPSNVLTSLENIQDHGSCPACQLKFPLDLSQNVELILRVSPEVRRSEVESYCIGGPAHSPHVAAQVRLAEHERFVLNLELEPGTYHLRVVDLPGVVEIEVAREAVRERADIKIDSHFSSGSEGPTDARLSRPNAHPAVVLRPSEQRLVLSNSYARPITFRVERVAARRDALTVAKAVALPVFRQLFPGETLERGRLLTMSHATFLGIRAAMPRGEEEASSESSTLRTVVELVDSVTQLVEQEGGTVARIDEGAVVAVFQTPSDATRTALSLRESQGDRVALAAHVGSVMATTINGRLEYLGTAVSLTRKLTETAKPGSVVLTHALLDEGSVARQLHARGLTLTPRSLERVTPGLWGVEAS